VLNGN